MRLIPVRRPLQRRGALTEYSSWAKIAQAHLKYGQRATNEDTFNLSVRRFLKSCGVNGQRDIGQAVAKAILNDTISGTETLPARITIEIAGLKLKSEFKGDIALQ